MLIITVILILITLIIIMIIIMMITVVTMIIISWSTANLRTKIVDFGGVDSSVAFILRGGMLMPIGDFPETLSQRILVGIILVGRLGAL